MREKIEVHAESIGPYGAYGPYGRSIIEGQEWAVKMEQCTFQQILADIQDHASTDGWDGGTDVTEVDLRKAISRFLMDKFSDGMVWEIYLEYIRPGLEVREAEK